MKIRNEKIVGAIVKVLRELKVSGSLTGVEQVDGDIVKVFIDFDLFGYFSLVRGEFVTEDDEKLGAFLRDEAGLMSY